MTLGSIAALLVACQAVIGLDKFKKDDTACDFKDCAVEDASDGMVGTDSPVDYFGDANSPHRWVGWPMPNPADADTDANIVSYKTPFEAGVDGGNVMVVHDNLTNLEWTQSASSQLLTFLDARAYCEGLGNNFRLPTRIELVSLWDYTRTTAFDLVFSGGDGSYWTASPALPIVTAAWVVSFGNGGTVTTRDVTQPASVRCVR